MEIPFNKGIYRTPANGQDGELDVCVNLRPSGGELMNAPRLEYYGVDLPVNSVLYAVHAVGGEEHYIYTRLVASDVDVPTDIDSEGGTTGTYEPVHLTLTKTSKTTATWSLDRPLEDWEFIKVKVRCKAPLPKGGGSGEIYSMRGQSVSAFFRITPDIAVIQDGAVGGSVTVPSGVTDITSLGVYNYKVDGALFYSVTADYTEENGQPGSINNGRSLKVKNRITAESGVVYTDEADTSEESVDETTFNYGLYYYDGSASHIIRLLPDAVQSVTVLGNTLIVRSAGQIYYTVWKDGGYKWLGSEIPDLDIQFRLIGDELEYFYKRGVRLAYNKDVTEQATYSKVVDTATLGIGESFAVRPANITPGKNYKLRLSKVYSADNKRRFQLYLSATEPTAQQIETREGLYYVGRSNQHRSPELTFHTDETYHFLIIYKYQATPYTLTLMEGADVSEIAFKSLNEDEGDAGYNMVMGVANEFCQRYGREDNRFVFPFFVRYAVRLFDGSTVHASAPCLMLPSAGMAPLIWTTYNDEDLQADFAKDLYCEGIAAQLQYRILDSDDLADWDDIITGVSIGVTPPVYTYNQGKAFDPQDCAIRIEITEKKLVGSEGYGDFVGVPLINANGEEDEQFNCGTYTRNFLFRTKNSVEDDDDSKAMVFHLPSFSSSELRERIVSASTFHVVKTLKPEEVAEMADFQTLELEEGTLLGLESRTTITDNHTTHTKYIPEVVKVYNQRLVLGNITEEKLPGFKPSLMSGYSGPYYNGETEGDGTDVEHYSLYGTLTEYGENGKSYVMGKLDAYDNHTPVWLYYPGVNAARMTVYSQKEGAWYQSEVDLEPHKSLNGAYWFGNFEPLEWEPAGITQPPFTADTSALITYPNKVVQSEPANPFVFLPSMENYVGEGEVLGMAVPTAALSEGQFGQFPLYCFCSDGIWALATGSDGRFTATTPVSRDVTNNPGAITETDHAVFFSTRNGLKSLDGSRIIDVASHMEGIPVVSADVASGIDDGCDAILLTEDYEWNSMLPTARMGFDYTNNLLHVYPDSEYDYHFAVDTASGEVTVLNDGAEPPLTLTPAYPETIITKPYIRTHHGSPQKLFLTRLYRFGKPGDFSTARCGVAVTRPLAAGNPLSRKTVTDLRVLRRLYSDSSSVRIAILASDDQRHWVQVGSLRQHSFKYFRFAVFTHLTDADRLQGIYAQTEERRTDKIR